MRGNNLYLFGIICAVDLCGTLALPAAIAQELPEGGTLDEYPLEPADTSSPRATLYTFVNEGSLAWREALERGRSATGGLPDTTRRVIACLDLSQVPPAQLDDVSTETAVLLLDVLYRTTLPAPEDVPDEPEMKRLERTRWTVPHTPIAIARVEEGPRAGEWLFTPETVERAKEFYLRTRQLPVQPGAPIEDGYRLYIAVSGSMIPTSWVEALPEWARATYLEQTVWQWGLLIVLLLIGAVLAWVSLRWSRANALDGRPSAWRRLVGPVSLMLLAYGARYVSDQQLNITGRVLVVLRNLLDSIFFLAAAWGVLLGARLLIDTMRASPHKRLEPLNAQFAQMGLRLASLAAVVVLFGAWLSSLGVPVLGVLAGLGIGGLAIALGAQRTIENFFGAFTIFADRPVRIGDVCRFGDKIGTVESIGLRSTRIRTPERSVLTVPNAEFARFQLDNLGRRDRLLFKATLNLRLETTTEQLERVLTRVREVLLGHEAIDEDPARVRLVAIGPHSLDLEIFAYVRTRDWNEFLAIREALLMRILHEVEEAGTALAPPARIQYTINAGAQRDEEEPALPVDD